MSSTIFTGIVNNITLLLALGVLYNFIPTRQRKGSLPYEMFTGLVIGAIGAAVMLSPLTLTPGIIIDTRSVVLSLAGLFFGTIPTAVAVVITITLRALQGGAGAATGISVIFATAAAGVAWRHLRKRWLAEHSWLELYLFGIAAHIIMLALLLPLLRPSGMSVVRSVGITVILLYPLATALMGKLLAYQQSRQDTEDRIRKAETGLRASEERYRLLIDHAADGILIANPDGRRIIQVNESACAMLGYTPAELLTLSTRDLVFEEDLPDVLTPFPEMGPGNPLLREQRLRCRDGSVISVENNTVLLPDGNLQSIVRDITTRKQMEKSFLSTQKMASLGTLAAGVAHEINSPLQVITGLCDRHLRILGQGDLDAQLLETDFTTLKRNAWRIAEIVRSLLNFARPSLNKMAPHDLTAIIEDTLLLTEHTLRSWQSITIEKDLEADMPPLVCDRNSLTQVLINLLTNAADAMPNGGAITIHTRHQAAIKHVILQISDTGVGIPEATLQKVFDPFYTTKDVGSGTGLGLSIVRSIVEAHDGTIACASVPNQGSMFSITLPLAGPAARPESDQPSEERFA